MTSMNLPSRGLFESAGVREALSVPEHIPVLLCDARKRYAVVEALLALCAHALTALPN